MKLGLTILLILGFVGVAVFGYLWVGPVQNCCHQVCIADVIQGGTCPEPYNPFTLANYHILAFQSLSKAIGNPSLLILLTVLFSLIFFTIPKLEVLNLKPLVNDGFARQTEIFSFKLHFQNWLKLFEKRDPVRQI